MEKLIVIEGTTASGKSDLGVLLAERLQGEIVSADSRQVFRGLDIGSGKITKAEMRGVPHHLLDVADPGDFFSAPYKFYNSQLKNKFPDRIVVFKRPFSLQCSIYFFR